jgi:hypothetical protein
VRTFAAIVIFLILVIIILSIPSVQTSVAKKVTSSLNETYGTDINIERLGLNWKGEVDVREVYIADHHQDTLIYTQQLQTNIISFSNLIKGDLGFGSIDLDQAKFYLKTYKGEEEPNITQFAKKFDTGQSSGTVFSMFSNDVVITNGTVKIIDENLDTPELFHLTNVNIIADNLQINGPEVDVDVQELSLDAQRGFHVKNLRTTFSYTPEAIAIRNMTLETRKSILKGEVIMTPLVEGGYSNFEDEVNFDIELNNSEIATDDLNAFYDEFGNRLMIAIDASMTGTLNDFTITNTDLQMGNTRMRGSYSFKNILKGADTYEIQSPNHLISTNYYDLRRIMPRLFGDLIPIQLKPLGNFSFNGSTQIDKEELSTNSKLRSAVGAVDASLLLGNMSRMDNAYYRGCFSRS